MASQVPYTGVPTVSPSLTPAPERRIDAPLAAFGGLTAQATSHLGQVADTAGNEIFARGLAMQQLNQQADANRAVADYQGKLVQSYLDYTSKMGKDAVDALPAFMQAGEQTRQQVRDSLGSDFAKKQFDSESRGAYWRTVFSAGIHAKDQNRQYVVGSIDARVASAGNQALSIPEDDVSFNKSVEDAKSLIDQKGQLSGWDPQRTELEKQNATSGLWAQRIQGLARTQPFAADKMLKQAQDDGSIAGNDAARLSDYIGKIKATVGGRNLAGRAMTGEGFNFDAPVTREMARVGIKGSEGGNYTTTGPDVNGDHALGAYQVMASNLPSWLREAGMPAMTEQEFLRSPAAQDKLFDARFNQYMQDTGSFDKAAVKWFGGQGGLDKYLAGKNVSDGFHNAPWYLTQAHAAIAHASSLGDLTAAGTRLAQQADPDDPLLPDVVTHSIHSLYNDQLAVRRDAEFNNKQTIEQALFTPNQQGMLPSTVEDLTHDPKVEAAWNAMNFSDQNRYRKELAANAAGPRQPSNTDLNDYKQLIGMRNNDPAAFMDVDIIGKYPSMPANMKKQLIDMQGKVQKGAMADPRLGHAMQVLAPTLQSAGLSRKDQDNYNLFTGELHDLIEQYQTVQQRPPKDADIIEMGNRLLQQHAVGASFWHPFGQSSELYRFPVPQEDRDAITNDPAWIERGYDKLDGAVQDRIIQRTYTAARYQKLYSRPAQPQRQPAPAQPQVPRSQ